MVPPNCGSDPFSARRTPRGVGGSCDGDAMVRDALRCAPLAQLRDRIPRALVGRGRAPMNHSSDEMHSPVGGPLEQFLVELGPGLVTGATDDDPSGISTYSVAGGRGGPCGAEAPCSSGDQRCDGSCSIPGDGRLRTWNPHRGRPAVKQPLYLVCFEGLAWVF